VSDEQSEHRWKQNVGIDGKEQWIGAKLQEAEDAAVRGDSKTVYKLAKTLSGKASQTLSINGADGKPQKSQEEANRRIEHFSAVLNCSKPKITHDVNETVNTVDIDEEKITIEVVKNANKKSKNMKSSGIYDIQADKLKFVK